MKKTLTLAAMLLLAGSLVAIAASNTNITERQLRDPKQLLPILNENARIAVNADSIQNSAPTNGQAVTLTQSYVVFRGTGASGSTNTITLATPWTAGKSYWLTVDHRATTDVLVADSAGLLGLGGNIILEPTDSVGILTTSTTNLVRIGGKSTN